MIKAIYDQGRGNPGVRRVRAGLAALGHLLSHKRVWRLMRAAGLQGRHPKAWKRTTVHGDWPVSAPDLIKRDFTAVGPNRRWCGDITYIKTWEGWAYLATVIDLYSRKVVGYAIAVSESFFATYKKELIHTRPWPDLKSLLEVTVEWIMNYYNTVRRHSTLGYLTPSEYELGFRNINHLAA